MKIQEPNLEIEQIFLRMPCCIWWIDRSHNILGCNIETCAAFRAYSPEEILGKTILEIANDKDLSEFKAKLIYDSDERIMKSGFVEYQIKSMVPHHITESPKKQLGAKQPIFNKLGEVIGLVCVVLFDHDIGKEFNERLNLLNIEGFKIDSSKSQNPIKLDYKEIFEITPCSLFWMNRKHAYLGGNRECCNIIEVDSQSKFVGKTVHEIIAMKNWPQYKAKNIGDLDEFIMKTGMPEFGIAAIIPRNDKSSIRQFAAKKPVFNINGETIGLIGAAIYDGQFG